MVFAWIGVHIKFILSFTMTTSSFVRLSWYKKKTVETTLSGLVSVFILLSQLMLIVSQFADRTNNKQTSFFTN